MTYLVENASAGMNPLFLFSHSAIFKITVATTFEIIPPKNIIITFDFRYSYQGGALHVCLVKKVGPKEMLWREG